MNQSNIHLFDLFDEILLMILKKLNNIDVLYSLLDVNNNRLDHIAREKQFTNTLNLVLSDQMILNRFYSDILPWIHQNIQNLTLESSSMKYILSAGNYPNLTHLKLYEFSQDTALEYFQSKISLIILIDIKFKLFR
jgi:hypothetical protein